MYVNGEDVCLPRIRTRQVSQSNPERELFGFTPTNAADYRAGGPAICATEPLAASLAFPSTT